MIIKQKNLRNKLKRPHRRNPAWRRSQNSRNYTSRSLILSLQQLKNDYVDVFYIAPYIVLICRNK